MDDLVLQKSQEKERRPSQKEKDGEAMTVGNKGKNEKKKIREIEPWSEEKPWRKSGADITDYFNYGFTEDTWEAYCKKQREMQAAMKKMVESNSKQEEGQPRPCSFSDSSRLFPRRRDSSNSTNRHYPWARRTRKVSSPKENRATHLFTSPDFMCPSDLYLLRPLSQVSKVVAMNRNRTRGKHRRSVGGEMSGRNALPLLSSIVPCPQ